jgi:lysine-N-methylase
LISWGFFLIIVYPDYYPSFYCIADRCRNSCCIGWEIDIDPRSLRRFLSLSGELGDCLRENIMADDDGAHFILAEGERCPFLEQNGLCRLIREKGEAFLCRICSDHPRYYHFRSDGIEKGLGLCCEAACDLILNQRDPVRFVIRDDGRRKTPPRKWEQQYVVLLNELVMIAQDRTKQIQDRLKCILSMVGMENADLTPSHWLEEFKNLEHMDMEWEYLLDSAAFEDNPLAFPPVMVEQLIVYFMYRHLFAGCQSRLAPYYIGFAVLSVRMILAIAGNRQEMLCDIARRYSAEIEYSDVNIQQIISCLQKEVICK